MSDYQPATKGYLPELWNVQRYDVRYAGICDVLLRDLPIEEANALTRQMNANNVTPGIVYVTFPVL